MRTRRFRTMAAIGATVMALAACSGDASAGGDGGNAGAGPGVDADAPPEEIVAAGLAARLENGAAFTFSLVGDFDSLSDRAGEAPPPELKALLSEGQIRGAFSPEGGFALSIGAGDGFFEIRAIDEALYLRADLEALAEFSSDASAGMPSAAELQGQLSSLPESIQPVGAALLAGDWVGITGLSQEALQSLAEDMGAGTEDIDVEEQEEAVRSILESKGLLDGELLTQRYLEVTGDGPVYDITVMARALVEAFNDVATELGSLGDAASLEDLPSPSDVPETVAGFSVTVDNGKAAAISGDIGLILESAGENSEDIQPGELVATLKLDDLGNQLDVPSGATTIDMEELVTAIMGLFGAFMGG